MGVCRFLSRKQTPASTTSEFLPPLPPRLWSKRSVLTPTHKCCMGTAHRAPSLDPALSRGCRHSLHPVPRTGTHRSGLLATSSSVLEAQGTLLCGGLLQLLQPLTSLPPLTRSQTVSNPFPASDSQALSLTHSLVPCLDSWWLAEDLESRGWKRHHQSKCRARQEVAGRQRLPACHDSSPGAKLCS